MKNFYFFIPVFLLFLNNVIAQDVPLVDKIANRYCTELSKNDTVTKANFEDVLPKLDEKIIFSESGYLPMIVKEVNEKNIFYKDFYASVYNKFSKECVTYQAIHGLDTSIHLKDPDFFTNSFCNCFNQETGGKIEHGDLTSVLKSCNEKLGATRAYKKKLRKELNNKKVTKRAFSDHITARFLTSCDLIVDHFFNRQAKYMEMSTRIMVRKVPSDK